MAPEPQLEAELPPALELEPAGVLEPELEPQLPAALERDEVPESAGEQEPNVLAELVSVDPVDPVSEVVRVSVPEQGPGTVSWIVPAKSERRVVLSSLKDLHRPADALPGERLSSTSARKSRSRDQKQTSKRANTRPKTRSNKRPSPLELALTDYLAAEH
ncbi:hypothetical protein [Arthrobacter ulcerisalmonis]|uniref:hypothetical protein n=1 Tax=Arthrobacter ulcerisalmonis TaxID=2483813 RepID=UPI00363E29D3